MTRLAITIIVGALLALGCGKDETPIGAALEKTAPKAEPKKAPPTPDIEKPVAEKAAEPAEEKATDPQPEAEPKAEEVANIKPGVTAEVGEPLVVKREGFHITALTLARGIEKTEDKKRIPVEPGDVVYIPPGTRHALRGTVEILNVVSPPFDAADEFVVED